MPKHPEKVRSSETARRNARKNVNSPWRKAPHVVTDKNLARHRRMYEEGDES